MKILMVCLGNICRSPTAEGVMRHLVDEAGLADRFEIELAYTIGVAHPVSVSIETYGTEKVADEKIMAAITLESPAFCVIDSIQTVYSDQLTSAPGSVDATS